MSHAPNEASQDPTKPQTVAYQEANNRQQELLRNGVSNSGHERNCCFLNTGTGRFANISAAAGMDHIGDGRAYALVDWDHDGDLDVWATNRTAPRIQFMRNNGGQEHHFLVVQLEGNGSTTNRDAIGARLELVLKSEAAGKLIKTVRAGEGFMSQSSKSLHFGMGRESSIDRLIVNWPGGGVEEFTNVEADRPTRFGRVADRLARGRGPRVMSSSPLCKTRVPNRPNRGGSSSDIAFPFPRWNTRLWRVKNVPWEAKASRQHS